MSHHLQGLKAVSQSGRHTLHTAIISHSTVSAALHWTAPATRDATAERACPAVPCLGPAHPALLLLRARARPLRPRRQCQALPAVSPRPAQARQAHSRVPGRGRGRARAPRNRAPLRVRGGSAALRPVAHSRGQGKRTYQPATTHRRTGPYVCICNVTLPVLALVHLPNAIVFFLVVFFTYMESHDWFIACDEQRYQ